MATRTLTLDEINAADQDVFVDMIGHVFESSPWIAAQAWHNRPFESVDRLHQVLSAIMWNAPAPLRLALIQAHPDLAGKAAIAGDLTADSSREQASAGLNRLTPAEYATFTRLNTAYRERFAFPFIICVREHTKESILARFEERLAHDRDREIEAALIEIAKIAHLRLLDTVQPD